MEWEKILTIDISDKRVSIKNIQITHYNSTTTKQVFKKIGRESGRYFKRKINGWGTLKAALLTAIRKMKTKSHNEVSSQNC